MRLFRWNLVDLEGGLRIGSSKTEPAENRAIPRNRWVRTVLEFWADQTLYPGKPCHFLQAAGQGFPHLAWTMLGIGKLLDQAANGVAP